MFPGVDKYDLNLTCSNLSWSCWLASNNFKLVGCLMLFANLHFYSVNALTEQWYSIDIENRSMTRSGGIRNLFELHIRRFWEAKQ